MPQFGVDNETDEISSSGIKGEPLESLNDVQIAGADSNTEIGGCKSEPSPAERQRKRKRYERSKGYMEKIKKTCEKIAEIEEALLEERDGTFNIIENIERHRRKEIKATGLHILGTNPESVDKFSSRELAASYPISNGCTNGADLLARLELEELSKVDLSQFAGLGGEPIQIGKYKFPPSLHQTVKKIIEWRDAIKDALRMNLKVDFAMEHLRKVARAYIGLMERRKLDDMASGIPSLEGQFSAGKAEHCKISEMSKIYMDAAEEFTGKAVSWVYVEQSCGFGLKPRQKANVLSAREMIGCHWFRPQGNIMLGLNRAVKLDSLPCLS
ncbi:hypothetical protein V6N13_118748 [Hibiscus sabdariffa]